MKSSPQGYMHHKRRYSPREKNDFGGQGVLWHFIFNWPERKISTTPSILLLENLGRFSHGCLKSRIFHVRNFFIDFKTDLSNIYLKDFNISLYILTAFKLRTY